MVKLHLVGLSPLGNLQGDGLEQDGAGCISFLTFSKRRIVFSGGQVSSAAPCSFATFLVNNHAAGTAAVLSLKQSLWFSLGACLAIVSGGRDRATFIIEVTPPRNYEEKAPLGLSHAGMLL